MSVYERAQFFKKWTCLLILCVPLWMGLPMALWDFWGALPGIVFWLAFGILGSFIITCPICGLSPFATVYRGHTVYGPWPRECCSKCGHDFTLEPLSDLSIRLAISGDLDRIGEIWHESAKSMDGAGPEIPSEDELRQRINRELQSGWKLYVALRGEKMVAMLALRPDAAILDQLFVSPEEQGKGVGRALMNFVKKEMPGGFLLRTAVWNFQGRRFCDREGLKVLRTGVHPRTGVSVCYYGWNMGA